MIIESLLYLSFGSDLFIIARLIAPESQECEGYNELDDGMANI
jgi:hypothetical protein